MKKSITAILILSMLAALFQTPISATEGAEINEVYFAEKFDDGIKGFGRYEGSENNVKNTVQIINSGGNNYLYLKKNVNGSDCYADFYVGKTKKNVIISFDMKVNNFGVNAVPLYVRDFTSSIDGTAKNDWLLLLTEDGILKSKNGSYQMKELTWLSVAMYLDLENKKYSVKINNNYIDENSDYSPLDIYALDMLRIYAGAGVGNLCIDNFCVYSGTEQRNVLGEATLGSRSPLAKTDAYSKVFLKNKTAIQSVSGTLYANGTRTKCSMSPVEKYDEIYVCAKDLSALLGKSVNDTGDAYKIDDLVLYKNSYKAVKGGTATGNDKPVYDENGTYLFPLEQTARLLGKYTLKDERGMLIISDTDLSETSDDVVKEIGSYMFFERETADDLKRLLAAKPQKHTSVLMDEGGFDRLKENIKTDNTLSRWNSQIIASADSLLAEALPVYEKNGIRIMNVCNSVQIRISKFAYAYRMTGDEKYATRAWEIMNEVCTNFPDWNADSHFLDTGIMAYTVGLYYDWFYDWLSKTPEKKDIVYNAAKKFLFDKAMGAYYGTDEVMKNHFFVKSSTNWNGVCNGGIAVAAMAMLEQDEDYLLDVISNAMRSLEYTVYEIGPDGAWEEGVGYWDFYLTYLARFMKTYDNIFGGSNNFADFKGMDKFGYFGEMMSSDEGNNNFHDSSKDKVVPDALFYLADIYNDNALATLWVNNANKLGIQADVDTVCFYNAFTGKSMDLDTVYYRGVEAISVKENPNDGNAMFFSAHGGKTEGAHSHYDAGTFIYDVLGERWATDLGMCNYDNQDVLGKENMYRVRSEGHNTLTINPSTAPGQNIDGFAKVVRFDENKTSAVAVMDLTSMYSDCGSAVRGFYVGDNRRSLTIRDELSMKNNGTVYWFMHTDAEITQISDKKFKLAKNGKTVELEFATDASSVSAYVADATPMESSLQSNYQDDNGNVKKLAIKMDIADSASLTVKIAPSGEGINTTPMSESIAKWSLSDTCETFDDGGVSGIYGRESDDKSLFADKILLPSGTERNGNGISEHICLYAAFEGAKYIDLIGMKNLEANESVITRAVEVSDSGSLKVCGQEILQSGFDFVRGKWYKIDLFIDTTNGNRLSFYADNKSIAKDVEFSAGDSVETITGFALENAYIDDYSHKSATEISLPSMTFATNVWKYRRYMSSAYGYYTFCDSNSDFDTMPVFSKQNVKDVKIKTADSAFGEKYLILTDSQNNKVYMPVFDLGKGVYDGKANQTAFDKTPLLSAPHTYKFDIKPNNNAKIVIVADGTEYTVFSFTEKNATLFGGTSVGISPNESYEIAVTVYPSRKSADIYVDGVLKAENVALSSTAISATDGYKVSDATVFAVKCYSGGYNCDVRTSLKEADKKFWIKSAFEKECTVYAAGYNSDGTLLKSVKVHDATLSNEATAYDIGLDNVCETRKVMVWGQDNEPIIQAVEY